MVRHGLILAAWLEWLPPLLRVLAAEVERAKRPTGDNEPLSLLAADRGRPSERRAAVVGRVIGRSWRGCLIFTSTGGTIAGELWGTRRGGRSLTAHESSTVRPPERIALLSITYRDRAPFDIQKYIFWFSSADHGITLEQPLFV